MSAAVTRRSASASPHALVSLHSSIDSSLFPLKSIGDVVNFFRRSLEQGGEPDLTLLSIIAGYIELSLTTGEVAQVAAAAASAADQHHHQQAATSTIAGIVPAAVGPATAAHADIIRGSTVPFPVVTHELVSGLYKKFQNILSVVERPKSGTQQRHATRDIIKKVSDVIWHSLIRSSYKDRAHLQNLYSYLRGNKLDCFGVALAVVAGCQLLGYRDVRLAIAEDHAWVVFGHTKRVETIEVTWHGRGSEDKRGQDITPGVESGSWLYLGGLAVICDRPMEVAAIVSAINISLTSSSDCVEVADLQQQLLWLLYDMGHLKKYPMALGTLGELEEIHPTRHKAIGCERLYREAVTAARDYYKNQHVYPHTYQGNYYNRLLRYRDAFAAWANAADVIRNYTYNCRDDEEIYKELLDIANEMIPYVMKTESSGHSARSILRDSEVFANLLRFYDGICQWEEDSLTPILHIGWAKPLVNNITKFDYDIRSQIVIRVPEDKSPIVGTVLGGKVLDTGGVGEKQSAQEAKKESNDGGSSSSSNNNNSVKKDEKPSNDAKKTDISTTLADLTAACGEKILNPDFLLQGGGQPFADQKQQQQQQQQQQQKQPKNNQNSQHNNNNNNNNNNSKMNKNIDEAHDTADKAIEKQEEAQSQTQNPDKEIKSAKEATKDPEKRASTSSSAKSAVATGIVAATQQQAPAPAATRLKVEPEEEPFEFLLKRPIITLYSQKMKGLKDLLLAEKLNTHAISLQVTAQSVASCKVRGVDKLGNQTTSSTYATVNVVASSVAAAAASSHHHQHHSHHQSMADASAASESIAVSRPKRMRRE